MLSVLPNDALRRQIGIQRPKLNDASDILALCHLPANAAHATGMTVDDLAVRQTVVEERVVPQSNRLPGQEAFDETNVNQLFIGRPNVRRSLAQDMFDDVFFVYRNNRFCIFRSNTVDCRSTGLPGKRILEEMAAGKGQRMGRGAFCGDHWLPTNPAHFVSDQLTRSLIFRDRLGLLPGEIYLSHSEAPLCQHMRRSLDPDFNVLAPDTLYHFEELNLLSSSRFDRHQGHPFWFLDDEILTKVSAVARKGLQAPQSPGTFVYLSRTDTKRRRLVNEDALIRRLEGLGARIVLMSELTGQEQLQMVHEASVVVAPHGGALLNLIAARPGTRVVELFTPEVGTLAFAGLAQALGLDYRFLIGTPSRGGLVDNMPWRIDVEEVVSLL